MRIWFVFSVVWGVWMGGLVSDGQAQFRKPDSGDSFTLTDSMSRGADRGLWPATASPRTEARKPVGRRYLQSLGGGLLGAGVGGGLGMLVGSVVVEERYSLRGEDPREVPAPLFGVWIGSIVGAMAGQHAAMEDRVIGLTTAGSFFGSLLSAGVLAVFSDGDPYWAASGFAVGAAAGAALGTTVAASPASQGLVTWRDGVLHPTLPTVRPARWPLRTTKAAAVVIVALHF